MHIRTLSIILAWATSALCADWRPDIYIYSDFGGGQNHAHEPIADWQTAIELAEEGWKLTHHPKIFINDAATPLHPQRAAGQVAATFPYLGPKETSTIERIVVHVVDPSVGNASQHRRALVLRRDGTLFIGPDNGTLSAACPPGSLAMIWEIDIPRLSASTGLDVAAGGTFHGRDVFAAAGYLLSAGRLSPEDIGKPYQTAELAVRVSPIGESSKCITFQELPTTRWMLEVGSDSLFSDAYFLAIVQSPLYVDASHAQLFIVDDRTLTERVAILNRKTQNLYIGPNNGLGTGFFMGFDKEDIWMAEVSQAVYEIIKATSNVALVRDLIFRQPRFKEELVVVDLLARENESKHISGHVWADAYGNLKTTLDSELYQSLIDEGYTNLTVALNGVSKQVRIADSFADVPAGTPFAYVGSSGAVGPNPHRSRRYVELTTNGINGQFGVDLFDNPQSGQVIEFYFTKNI